METPSEPELPLTEADFEVAAAQLAGYEGLRLGRLRLLDDVMAEESRPFFYRSQNFFEGKAFRAFGNILWERQVALLLAGICKEILVNPLLYIVRLLIFYKSLAKGYLPDRFVVKVARHLPLIFRYN